MMERKFTDEEVIKALECCNDNSNKGCDDCPFDGATHDDEPWCVDKLNSCILALINRQNAEIAELKRKYELAVAEREVNAKALIESAEKYPWERTNARYEDN